MKALNFIMTLLLVVAFCGFITQIKSCSESNPDFEFDLH